MRRDRTMMTRAAVRRCRAAAGLLVALLPAPAFAQYGPQAPQTVPDRPSDPQTADAPAPAAQSQLQRAAACLVARDADAGAALLATTPFSAGERQEAVRTLRAAERCLETRARLATSPILLRGALAEALYEARFAQPPPARSPAAAPAPSLPAEAAASRQDIAPAFALADCAAGRNAGLVRSLLAADPDGDAEAAALQALNPVFVECVAPGTSLNTDRPGLRALLAQSLYRWAVVQRDGSASPWAATPTSN